MKQEMMPLKSFSIYWVTLCFGCVRESSHYLMLLLWKSMKRNTLVLKLVVSTLWGHRWVFKIYTRGVSIGPRRLYFEYIGDLESSLIFGKLPFIMVVGQLELPWKVSGTGIRNSHIVKNKRQGMLENDAMWSINYFFPSFL